MKISKIYLAAIFLLLAFAVSAFAGRFGSNFPGDITPPYAPQLLFPITEDIDLTGKNVLEFKWVPCSSIDIASYDFRLYEGYQTFEANLILKKIINSPLSSFKLDSSKFEIDQVYTWVLRSITIGGQKSDKSFSSFKIIKK